MNKPVAWNINGVGFDAREAAREAARRQGKSLGEWLHGVIADHANETGTEARDMGSQQRIDALTSKLERLSGRPAAASSRRPEPTDDVARWRADRFEAMDDDMPRRTRSNDESRQRRDFDADALLEQAAEVMDRHARRTERRTDEALRSFADMLARNEAQRDRERQSVTVLADKLSALESRLSERVGATHDNPIKGALARLEARLDSIGKRSAAEAAAAKSTVPEPLHRFEEKLNSILHAVHARPAKSPTEISPFALAASHAVRPAKDRRLGEAIADIARRQQALDGDRYDDAVRGSLGRRLDALRPYRFDTPAPTQPLAAVQAEIAALAGKIEELRLDMTARLLAAGDARPEPSAFATPEQEPRERAVARIEDQMQEIRELILASSAKPSGVEHVERQLASLNQRLDNQLSASSPTSDLQAPDFQRGDWNTPDRPAADPALVSAPPSADLFGKIELCLETLAAKIDRSAADAEKRDEAARAEPSQIATPTTEALETLVRDLATKMDAARGPDASEGALEALQSQITRLASRFEASDTGLAKLGSLERSMRELFVQLDETRASVETSAARAAREVLRIAMEEGQAASVKGTATSLATVKALQDEAEARTSATLSAVHETLERVVDRLSMMEHDIDDVRRRPLQPAPTSIPGAPAASGPAANAPMATVPASAPQTARPARPKPAEISLGAPDPFLDQVLGQRSGDKGSAGQAKSKRDDEIVRADFIAAARHAAKAAQTEAKLTEATGADTDEPPSATRANLIAQSRAYVSRHKRPMLISLAALFVVLGTMAILQRMGMGGATQVADASSPAPVTERFDTRARPSAQAPLSDIRAPNALSNARTPAQPSRIPGSDPIQTGSIPSLPAFAGGMAAAAPPHPALPAGLTSMAVAGDSGAEYVLGTQYAEGRTTPRDFKMAAGWYQKAAAKGLAPAQYRLAGLYEKGLGVPEDKTKAKALYLQAAEAGNPRAMHNLAVLLADGAGHPDYAGAATWFRKAAQYGVHDSQYNLAILLARGLGVQQSLVQSYQWFAIAAKQNDADAAKKRDEVGGRLSSNDLAVAKALGAAFRPRAVDVTATEVQPPPGGWDGAATPTPLNSARQKISSL